MPSSPPHPPLPLAIPPPLFTSAGHVCRFFGYSLSYTALYIPMAILRLPTCTSSFYFFKGFYYFIFRERRREGEREGEKHQCVVASHAPDWGLACNQGMCQSRQGIKPGTLWSAGQHSYPLSHTSQTPFWCTGMTLQPTEPPGQGDIH